MQALRCSGCPYHEESLMTPPSSRNEGPSAHFGLPLLDFRLPLLGSSCNFGLSLAWVPPGTGTLRLQGMRQQDNSRALITGTPTRRTPNLYKQPCVCHVTAAMPEEQKYLVRGTLSAVLLACGFLARLSKLAVSANWGIHLLGVLRIRPLLFWGLP